MKRQTFNEINITPLTDIFLVLLIIMMVIAPMLDQQGLKLSIPEYVEQEKQDDTNSKVLTVIIDENNNYIIDDEIISSDNLNQTIQSLVKDYPDGLMIQANGDSLHEYVVKVMDAARLSGVKAISVSEI